MSGYYLYKYVVDDEIIYIGKSKNIHQRIAQHNSGTGLDEKFKPYLKDCKIFVAECVNSVEMDLMERALINQYKPKLNVADKFEGFSQLIQVQEPVWKKYRKEQTKIKPVKTRASETQKRYSKEEIIKRLRYYSQTERDEEDVFFHNEIAMYAFLHIVYFIKTGQWEEKDGSYQIPCYTSGLTVYDFSPDFISQNRFCLEKLPVSVVKSDDEPIPVYEIRKSFLNERRTKNYIRILKQSEVWKYRGEWEWKCMQDAIKTTLERKTKTAI